MSRSRVVLGVVMVLAGIVFLLQSLNLIEFGGLVWSLLFAAGGIIFLYYFVLDRNTTWWAAIPGMTLLSLGALIFVGENFPRIADNIGGAVFMGGLSLGFWLVYAVKRDFWWAIIPGGVLLSIAALIAVEGVTTGGGSLGVGVMFLGMALTFLLVYLLVRQPRMTWALIPAGVLGVMAIAFLLASDTIFRIIGPLALVAVGAYLIFRTAFRRA